MQKRSRPLAAGAKQLLSGLARLDTCDSWMRGNKRNRRRNVGQGEGVRRVQSVQSVRKDEIWSVGTNLIITDRPRPTESFDQSATGLAEMTDMYM